MNQIYPQIAPINADKILALNLRESEQSADQTGGKGVGRSLAFLYYSQGDGGREM